MFTRLTRSVLREVACLLCLLALAVPPAAARNPYRTNFFNAYPSAAGSVLATVPSAANHCGVCHYAFTGGGARNPYGEAVFATDRSVAAILSLGNLDSDGDGYTNNVEITDTVNYVNTPTFPGLKPSNVGSVSNVNLTDIQDHLVPSVGADTIPPAVTVITPNGGETITANQSTTVQWSATDAGGVASVNIYLSDDNGATFKPIAMGLGNSGSHMLFLPNRPTTSALIRVEAIDNAFNIGHDDSNAVFTVQAPPGGIAPTTLRDFDMPGSQPFDAGTLNAPTACAACHGGYDANVEPYVNWQGSMMAQASIDPLFEACTIVGNQDAPDSGDLCLRCHISKGWLRGRSVPTDGSAMLTSDLTGVSCDLCHRLVDPYYEAGNPVEDVAILAALDDVPAEFANGMFVVDPTGARRGPFLNASSGHPVLVSPFHREAALCGTCHAVSNTAFEKDMNGNFPPNAFDTPATDFASTTLMAIERTYSEWFHSAYNTPTGVYAPQFGGNKEFVATCQDCHLRDVTGKGCNMVEAPIREDLPLHDMTGGTTWLAGLLSTLHPGQVNDAAMQAGILRARYMLQNAAALEAAQAGRTLNVTVTNQTGHKLPTGYPEGRRMWINVRFYDAGMNLLAESGAYDPVTGVLSHDEGDRIYEAKPGLDTDTASLVGVDPGPSFHFVLNNKIYKDNRIPPRGYTLASFSSFGGKPVGAVYADGQYWDVVSYEIPAAATSVEVALYYQSTSKEYVEFLRDENTTNTVGQMLYDLWNNNGKCPPELMAQVQLDVTPPSPGDLDGDGDVDDADYVLFAECLNGPDVQTPPVGCPPERFEASDLDEDLDVDLADFGELAIVFGGP